MVNAYPTRSLVSEAASVIYIQIQKQHKNISEDTGTNNDKTNATYETLDTQTKKELQRNSEI